MAPYIRKTVPSIGSVLKSLYVSTTDDAGNDVSLSGNERVQLIEKVFVSWEKALVDDRDGSPFLDPNAADKTDTTPRPV